MNAPIPTSNGSDLVSLQRHLDEAEKLFELAMDTFDKGNMLILMVRAEIAAMQGKSATTPAPLSATPFLVPVKPATPVITFPAPAKEPEPTPVEPLVETEEWKRFKATLMDGQDIVLVTGGAGVGKTTLLRQLSEEYPGNLAVVASTGTAALLAGGITAHSMFRFPPHALDEDDVETLEGNAKSRLRAIKKLVLDEVSMFRADVIDAIDLSMRRNRNVPKPFGGAEVAMFGDPYQLPPVVKEKEEKKWLEVHYGTNSPFFFHAKAFRDKPPKVLTLTKVFRQKDEQFIQVLNAVRDGSLNEKQLELINAQVVPNFRAPEDELWITLTTTNASADLANQAMLSRLPGEAKVFDAFTTGDFNLKDAPTDEYLSLKVGANVIFVKNDSSRFHRWANGTLGRVTNLSPLRVKTDSGEYEVTMETWEKIAYVYDERTKKLGKQTVGSFSQIPLKLAAAITIHRSQGASLDRVILDLGTGSFASGQTYTGLSRCRSLAGLKLLRPLRMDDLIVSSEVRKFLNGEPIARPAPSPMMLL